MRLRHGLMLLMLGLMASAVPAPAADKSIVVASTTSTQGSGLFGFILPRFTAKTGIDVRVIAQGTGQALDTGRRGDADVVFVHAKPQEEQFVADGISWPPSRRSMSIRAPLSHVAINRGRTPPSSRCGNRPVSIRPPANPPGTARSARAWAPP